MSTCCDKARIQQMEISKSYYSKRIDTLTLEVERLTGENGRLRDLLRRLMSEFDEPDEYMTVFQEASAALEQGD